MILSYEERKERIEARLEDFKAGNVSRLVCAASLKILGMRKDDLNYYLSVNEPEDSPNYEAARLEASRRYVAERTKRRD